MLTKKEVPLCPIGVIAHLLGGKWKLLIIRNLLKRPWYFNELKRGVTGISHKMLTSCLRELENDGLVRRHVIPTARKSVQYSLTELGETLRPLFSAMKDWGEFYKKTVGLPPLEPRDTCPETDAGPAGAAGADARRGEAIGAQKSAPHLPEN